MKKKNELEEPLCFSCPSRHKSFYSNISEGDMKKVCIEKTCKFFAKGEVIFEKGNTPVGLYHVSSGKVKVYKTGVDGKEQIVRFVVPGHFLGIRSFAANKSYSANAAAMEDTTICFVSKEDFKDLMRKYPDIAFEMMESLANIIEDAENKIISLAQKPVKKRLAETLLLIDKTFSSYNGSEQDVDISLTREEIANIVGTATETVIRLLSEFKDENLISTKGRKIKILDKKRLEEAAN